MNAQSEKNNVRTLDYYKSFVNNNILLIVGSILIYAKGIILLPIIIKNAGIAFYGRYVLVVISISLIVGIFSCGIGFKCKRFLPSAEEMAERRKLFYPPLIMQLLSIAMISVVALIFNQFIKTIILNNQFDYSITLIISILFLSVVYNMATDYFRYTHRATVFTVATTSEPYLMILFVVVGVFLWRLNTLNFFLFSYVLSLLCVTIPLFALIIKEIGFKYVRIRLKDIADDVRLGFPLVLSYIVDF
ncbi:MAG: hypothetical protein KKH94_08615, partial [Candidatus Omnitrophica bacterium]|nr:hypothetical protein [Candidatus Omnitrophota bacterium]